MVKPGPKKKNHGVKRASEAPRADKGSALVGTGGFAALAGLGRALNNAGTLEEVSGLVLEHLAETAGCGFAMLHLGKGRELSLQGMRRSGPGADEPEEQALNLGGYISRLAIQNARPFYHPPAESAGAGLPRDCPSTPMQSFAGLPLFAEGHGLGALALGWLEQKDLSPHQPYLEAVSALAAAALQKAYLKNELERRIDELGRNEKRFRTAFMIGPDAVNLTRLSDGALVEVNQAFLDMSGFSREEVLGRTTLELDLWAKPQDRERLTLGLMQDGKVENLTVNFRLKDGRIATGITSAKLIELEGESYVLGFTRDITAQLEAERALKQSEENFRQMAESVGEVFWLRTSDNPPQYLYISPAFEEVWGISREILYRDGANLLETVIPEDRDGMALAMERNLPTPKGKHHEFRIKRPDGSIRWMWARRYPITDDKGKVYRVAGLARDVTERRLTEMALKESESKLAAVINSVDEIILMLDDQLTIVWANDVASNIYGQDLMGSKCYEICMGRSQPCQPCLALKTLSDGAPHEIEIESRSAEGEPLQLWGRATAAGHHSDDRPKSVVVVYRDMTHKKALEAEAMRAGRLASIGELAAGVAHEINNPINGIINCAEMLAQADKGKLSSGELISRIISEGERVAAIVHSLLSFAREGSEAMEPVSLPAVLDDCLALIEAQLNKDGTVLALKVDPDLPLVWGHAHQLQQVALNLMSNARHALNQKYQGAHPEKRLAITARELREPGRRLVRLVFHDSGAGLARGTMDKVFDPFFTTKPPGKGTGLGLSISHGIVTAHGGELSIDSRPGEYTEAVVDLPAFERSQKP